MTRDARTMADSLRSRARRAALRTTDRLSQRLRTAEEHQQQAVRQFRALPQASRRQEVIDEFHRYYYDEGRDGGTWHRTSWFDTKVWKCPLDLWIYQEIIHRIQPDLIIETGTAFGGSALYLAGICELLGRGSVISIDIAAQPGLPEHPRVRYVAGSSVDDVVLAEVARATAGLERVMVVLDSDHSQAHVARELEAYAPTVTVGSYLIVEDTNVNGHPVFASHGPGPREATEEFLRGRTDFVRDAEGDKFLLTFNPGGMLRRVR
jgi:cephalosporin hydroxylase